MCTATMARAPHWAAPALAAHTPCVKHMLCWLSCGPAPCRASPTACLCPPAARLTCKRLPTCTSAQVDPRDDGAGHAEGDRSDRLRHWSPGPTAANPNCLLPLRRSAGAGATPEPCGCMSKSRRTCNNMEHLLSNSGATSMPTPVQRSHGAGAHGAAAQSERSLARECRAPRSRLWQSMAGRPRAPGRPEARAKRSSSAKIAPASPLNVWSLR